MTTDDILSAIEAVSDMAEARKISHAAKARVDAIADANHQAALAETWERMKWWKPGIDLWCCAEGVFIGGGIQRGDKVTLVRVHRSRIDARKGAWLRRRGGASTWFSVRAVLRYNFRTVKPEKPIDPIERKAVESVAKVVTDVLGKRGA